MGQVLCPALGLRAPGSSWARPRPCLGVEWIGDPGSLSLQHARWRGPSPALPSPRCGAIGAEVWRVPKVTQGTSGPGSPHCRVCASGPFPGGVSEATEAAGPGGRAVAEPRPLHAVSRRVFDPAFPGGPRGHRQHLWGHGRGMPNEGSDGPSAVRRDRWPIITTLINYRLPGLARQMCGKEGTALVEPNARPPAPHPALGSL